MTQACVLDGTFMDNFMWLLHQTQQWLLHQTAEFLSMHARLRLHSCMHARRMFLDIFMWLLHQTAMDLQLWPLHRTEASSHVWHPLPPPMHKGGWVGHA